MKIKCVIAYLEIIDVDPTIESKIGKEQHNAIALLNSAVTNRPESAISKS
jgi:hypothetical protein